MIKQIEILAQLLPSYLIDPKPSSLETINFLFLLSATLY